MQNTLMDITEVSTIEVYDFSAPAMYESIFFPTLLFT